MKFECARIILLFCRRKYAVNFELQLRRKSVRDVVQIDYGIPLEDPWSHRLPFLPSWKRQITLIETHLPNTQFPLRLWEKEYLKVVDKFEGPDSPLDPKDRQWLFHGAKCVDFRCRRSFVFGHMYVVYYMNSICVSFYSRYFGANTRKTVFLRHG